MPDTKVIVITGASSGIGAEMARRFAAEGAIVYMTARSLEKMEQLAREGNGNILVRSMDVTSTDAVSQTLAKIEQECGRIDVLINNAGFAQFETFVDAEIDSFASMMDVNYLGVVRCTKAVLPGMLRRGSGHVINIASVAGKIATPKSTAYTASKHALLGFTNALRMETAGSGVRVSAVNPGPIRTPFFERADPDGQYLRNMPQWFILRPEKVAQVVVDLVRRPRNEVNLPRVAGMGVRWLQAFPGLMHAFASRFPQ